MAMRLGLSGATGVGVAITGDDVDRMIAFAQQAEAEGFSSLWYTGSTAADPVAVMGAIGRATERIELGTAVLQSLTCHPVLQANRCLSARAVMGRPGFVLGIGPSHRQIMEDTWGLSYDHAGRDTEEYVRILCARFRGDDLDVDGEDYRVHLSFTGPDDPRNPATWLTRQGERIPVLVAAHGPRMLRVGGAIADGIIPTMLSPRALEEHVVPRVMEAATAAGRPAPRIVTTAFVAVHDDEAEARAAAREQLGFFLAWESYRRILEVGGVSHPADLALVGGEAAVTGQLQALFDAGVTDVHVSVVPVGDDPERSRRRTLDLLRALVA
jgi:F420-dependent oxidoreductase-like protein